jgi:small GTP-binding protein
VSAVKVVIAGPVGVGKTTVIGTLAEGEVVETEERASEDIGKPQTTVALDYGVLKLDGTAVHLFGTPGQDRFDFMWEVLCEGALGLVLLVSGKAPGQFASARKILEFITSRIRVPFLIGVTHQDLSPVWEPEEVADYFGLPTSQVLGLDATCRTSALTLLISLLERIEVGASR